MENSNFRPSIRYIPRKTRVKTEFAKGITGADLFYAAVASGVAFAVWYADFFDSMVGNLALVIVVLVIFGVGFIPVEQGLRGYGTLWRYFKFMAYAKRYAKVHGGGYRDIKELVPYRGIIDDKFIDFGEYFGMVLELKPIEFGLLDAQKQEMVVQNFANAIRRITSRQNASLIRLERGMVLDKYIDYEVTKYKDTLKAMEMGSLSESELSAREIIFNERGLLLEFMNNEEKVFKSCYYFVVYDADKTLLENTINGMRGTLGSSSVAIESEIVRGKDLVVFLRANYNKDFDERELNLMPEEKWMNWVTPNKITFGAGSASINGLKRAGLAVTDYPLEVGNAWGYGIFNLPGTRTVLNFHQVPKASAEKMIDKAILEMKTQMGQSHKSSHQIDRNAQLSTITDLLVQIKQNNEQMLDCSIHLTPDFVMKKEVESRLYQDGFKFSRITGRHVDSFIATNISRLETFPEYSRGIPTTTVAATFPFISDMLQDDRGICIGSNSYPVFIDFFKRNNVRVNSNMIIIGKSGSGKSFAAKSILAHLAADNTKIFICDPEKEYVAMAEKLHGAVIDVGNAGKGRFNPFHIYPAMLDDEDGVEFDDTFESHLRFLESFFKIVMEGIRADALEVLNGLVAALYKSKGIDKHTDFSKLQPNQFPVFEELFILAKRYLDAATDDFSRVNYRTLVTYLEKFAEGGRYSGLWNGPASITSKENFFVFNFLTLLANKNSVVANAQMLLVFKYLDGEIIKNREYNMKHKVKRKIVIVVDEAHVFIDEKKPIALDFMFNMAKRIRKYDGMQVIITQNIKDFVGSPVIAKKSAAIINASQYSMIFSLAPNDMTDLITLYKNAGGINKSEQEQIVSNQRGTAFFVTGPMNRTIVSIETSQAMMELFE
ncbi:MAG: DUF87 domain-containing protein [Firmicutes bacterium]|nr:DUF87 domain-containing protein [Bacillota bacterium]